MSHYVRFGLMITTSVVVMFCLKYLSTYEVSHEPPEDCKKIVYGYDVKEHFVGLMQPSSGKPLELNDIPDSEYLIVEYFAEWCPPCHPARKKLESFIESIDSAGYIALIVDFTAMQNEI